MRAELNYEDAIMLRTNGLLYSQNGAKNYMPQRNNRFPSVRQFNSHQDVITFRKVEREKIKNRKGAKSTVVNLFLEGQHYSWSKEAFSSTIRSSLGMTNIRTLDNRLTQDSPAIFSPPKNSTPTSIKYYSLKSVPNRAPTKAMAESISCLKTAPSKAKGRPSKQLDQKIVSPDNRTKPILYLDPNYISQHIKAESFIVMEAANRQIITGKSFRQASQIASLTKIMTFYTVITICQQLRLDWSVQIIKVDEEDAEMSGTSADIVDGDTYTVEQLFYGLMLPSGNDAAIALAKWGGSKIGLDHQPMKSFCLKMNACAKTLQMRQSSFVNPHGLPHPKNLSNPQDLALLVANCLQISIFKKVVSTREFKCWVANSGVQREVVWENTNKLLRRPGFSGVKTGVTITAGPCLASCYQTHHRTFIVVLLRAAKLSRRFKQTRLVLAETLRKLDLQRFRSEAAAMALHNQVMDSDNSEDEKQFNFERNDDYEMKKRKKILTYEM